MIEEDRGYEFSMKQAIDHMHCHGGFLDASIRDKQLIHDRIMVINK